MCEDNIKMNLEGTCEFRNWVKVTERTTTFCDSGYEMSDSLTVNLFIWRISISYPWKTWGKFVSG